MPGEFFENLKVQNIFIMEARPLLESSRSNSRFLLKNKITPTVIADNMAGFLFFQEWVKDVWIAFQAESKDALLCDTGALILAVLGKRHRVPVNFCRTPVKTKLFATKDDILTLLKEKIAPGQTDFYAPCVEWVPKKYVTRINHGTGRD